MSYLQHLMPLLYLVIDWCCNPVMFVFNQIPLQMILQVVVVVAFTIYSSNLTKPLVYAQVSIEVSRDDVLTLLIIGLLS